MNREQGQVTVLALGMCIVVLAVSGLAIDGTRAFLFRRTLQNAADAAALAAVGAVDRTEFYATGGKKISLQEADVEATAQRLLAERGVPAGAALEVGEGVVRLQLRGAVKSTFLSVIGIEKIEVAVESRAAPIEGDAG